MDQDHIGIVLPSLAPFPVAILIRETTPMMTKIRARRPKINGRVKVDEKAPMVSVALKGKA